MIISQKYFEDDDQFDVFLFKLNQDLESDTFYKSYFQYDTLCPYTITSDTIVQDSCDIIVGIHDYHESVAEEKLIGIYPNPSTYFVNIRYLIFDTRYSLFIYDMYGRLMKEIVVPVGQDESRVGITSFPEGIYIVVLRDEGMILGREKFVVVKN